MGLGISYVICDWASMSVILHIFQGSADDGAGMVNDMVNNMRLLT